MIDSVNSHIATASMSYSDTQYAGFWRRFVAFIIDTVILIIVSLIIGLIFGVVFLALGMSESAMELTSNLLGAVIGWLYFAGLESSQSMATFGKQAMGLKVANEAGERISFARATGRYFGKFVSGLILGIGFLMIAFTARKQGLHDMMTGCLVQR